MKRILVGALCAAILLVTPMPSASASAEPDNSAKLVEAAKAIAAQKGGGGSASASAAGNDGTAGAAETRAFGDPAGDVPFCQGDITGWNVAYAATLSLSMTTQCSSNPATSANWYPGETALGWILDNNGDGEPDYVAVYFNDGAGNVVAGTVRMSDEMVTCDDAGLWNGNKTYSVSFAAGCVGTPAAMRLGAVFTWDENPNGVDCVCPTDIAPNDDWSQPVYFGNPPVPGTGGSGYWMLGQAGTVYAFGDARHYGNADVGSLGAWAVDIASNPKDNGGYWILSNKGHVFAFGSAPWHGNPALQAGEQAATIIGTKSGNGYYVFTNRGRALAFGDAVHRGDMSGIPLNGPVLDSTLTGAGNGYYMVGSDGGVFSFNAQFYGSMGGKPLNRPVNGISGDPDNVGYWLVASDGGIFAFSAPFKGSMGGKHLNRPVVGMVAYGDGYLMVASDGGIFNFSTKAFRGSLGANPPAVPIQAVAPIR